MSSITENEKHIFNLVKAGEYLIWEYNKQPNLKRRVALSLSIESLLHQIQQEKLLITAKYILRNVSE